MNFYLMQAFVNKIKIENMKNNNENDAFINDAWEEESKLYIEFMDDVTKHDYSYMYSDSHNNYMNGSGSDKNIKEKLHILIGICRYDAIQLLDDVLSAVPEQFKDGLTHKVIRGWFAPYVEDEGPEVDGAGFTDDDRIVNGQYKTNK